MDVAASFVHAVPQDNAQAGLERWATNDRKQRVFNTGATAAITSRCLTPMLPVGRLLPDSDAAREDPSLSSRQETDHSR
jgi:hypothetical protein